MMTIQLSHSDIGIKTVNLSFPIVYLSLIIPGTNEKDQVKDNSLNIMNFVNIERSEVSNIIYFLPVQSISNAKCIL